jgi:hypothetical protein
MAFTPHPTLEKVTAFCTAETNFVLHSKQNKNKDNISCQKGREKASTGFRRLALPDIFPTFTSAFNKFPKL